MWDAATRRLVATLTDPAKRRSVNVVAYSPDGTTLAAGDYNGRTYLWDAATRRLVTTLPGALGLSVFGLAFSPDGKTLAAGNQNGIYLWDTR